MFSLRHLMAITSITVKNATRNVMLIKDWNFPSFLTFSHYIWNVLTLIILLCTESNSMISEYIVKESLLAMHDLKFWQQCWWRFKSSELLRRCSLALVMNILKECSAYIFTVKQSKVSNSENRAVFCRSGWFKWQVCWSGGPVYWVAYSKTCKGVGWHQPVVLSEVWKGSDGLQDVMDV